jgi:hypothetical protein
MFDARSGPPRRQIIDASALSKSSRSQKLFTRTTEPDSAHCSCTRRLSSPICRSCKRRRSVRSLHARSVGLGRISPVWYAVARPTTCMTWFFPQQDSSRENDICMAFGMPSAGPTSLDGRRLRTPVRSYTAGPGAISSRRPCAGGCAARRAPTFRAWKVLLGWPQRPPPRVDPDPVEAPLIGIFDRVLPLADTPSTSFGPTPDSRDDAQGRDTCSRPPPRPELHEMREHREP